MKVLLSGSSGLVGRALLEDLKGQGHVVHALVRRPASDVNDISWDPGAGALRATEVSGFDAVVHLAGENIAEGRWNKAKMDRIRSSRVEGTRLLCKALADAGHRPSVFICASAVGFYGDRADQSLDESSAAGSGFLPEVCKEWEQACDAAREAGIRVVNLRIGVVLSKQGGALAKMLLPFRMGLGGRIGSGRQWMSWVELQDLVGIITHSMQAEDLEGPVNAVSPFPVTNGEYTSAMGRVLSRPTAFPVPAPIARLAFGKMAQDLLLASIRVEPKSLIESGFQFSQPRLEGALRAALV
jgi:uncharacterized protein